VRRSEGGFTIVEVMVAMIVLSIGVVALVGSAGKVNRMIGRGKWSTFASQVAQHRLDRLRALAASTGTPCTAAGFASNSVVSQKITETWQVPASGTSRLVRVIVSYPVPGGTKSDTVSTRISCT
jgi:type IV pilus assembly protein PilV